MRAFVLTRYGGPDAAEIRDVAEPSAGPGEIRIRVAAAGLNPVDFKTREGKLRIIRRYSLPVVLGSELAGTVDQVGAGVTRFAVGDRVFSRVSKESMGAFAEKVVVLGDLAAKIPRSIDFDVAAGVPLAALTAVQALRDELAICAGRRVFVSAGAGGVGTFAIQIAKALGAEVATTASPRGAALVKGLGADLVVDYTTGRFEDAVGDCDGAFDLLGGDSLLRTFATVKPGGKVISIAGVPEPLTATKDLGRGFGLAALFWLASLKVRLRGRRRNVGYRYLFMHPDGAELENLAARIDEGKLRVVVDRVFPFAEIKEAFAHLEAGRAKGKVIVRMDGATD